MGKLSSPAIDRYLKITQKSSSLFKENLRIKRHMAWIEAAQATLNNSKLPNEICQKWSEETDAIVTSAWQHCQLDSSHLCLFALGKWGAKELNLSSDIDFIVISDKPINKDEQKLFNSFLSLLNENSEFGFCYRTDINLRPGGRFGPIISSLLQAQDYYWNSGATWEKLALVRLRKICGSVKVAEDFHEIVEPFIFRKYLDFTLFEDLKGLREKIHISQTSGKKINIKLHPGGIRDIELFVNALQVIHGGRVPQLRVNSTTEAIRILKEQDLFHKDSLNFLEESYWSLRDIENKIQAREDQQTHVAELDKDSQILKNMSQCQSMISTLIGFKEESHFSEINGSIGIQRLVDLGFNERSAKEIWPEIIKLTSKSTKTERDEMARSAFLYEFTLSLSQRAFGKDLGIELLRDFIKSTRAKATFFTTLLRDPTLIEDLSYIFSSSALIGNFVVNRPELIDSLILKRDEPTIKDFGQFLINLVEAKKLHQIHSVIKFLKTKNIVDLCMDCSSLADELCLKLLERISQETQIDLNIEILALGKWGGCELGIAADLDFIFVSKAEPTASDFKIAKRFLSRLTEQQASGSLYNYDLRLRPSGQSGPLLVSIDKLKNYLSNEAQAWERQSFLKARSISNNSELSQLSKTYISKGLSKEELSELDDILKKLISTDNNPLNIDLKYSNGGFVNIELVVQRIVLENKIKTQSPSLESMIYQLQENFPTHKLNLEKILANYKSLRLIEQLYQIKSGHSGSNIKTKSQSFEQVCFELDQSPENVVLQINNTLNENLGLLKTLITV